MVPKIIPGIIAKNQMELNDKIEQVKDEVERIQLDIMDGIFVGNKSLDFDFWLPKTDCQFEAHLMVADPDDWVERNWQKAGIILVPAESCKHIKELIDFLKGKKKFGLVLNPETSLDRVRDYLDEIDQILIMTVTPGFYGSEFLSKPLEKVKELRRLKPDLDIGVDGGLSPETIKKAFDAGANLFVSGSYIFRSENPKEAIRELKNSCLQ